MKFRMCLVMVVSHGLVYGMAGVAVQEAKKSYKIFMMIRDNTILQKHSQLELAIPLS